MTYFDDETFTEGTANRFHVEPPSYQNMKVIATSHGQLLDFDDESIPCFCGD